MKFAVVGVSYHDKAGEVVGDEVIAISSERLFALSAEEWHEALAKCCKGLVGDKRHKCFLIQFRAWCELSGLEECIADIRRSLDDFWQMRYELNQSVPPSFVPVSTGG